MEKHDIAGAELSNRILYEEEWEKLVEVRLDADETPYLGHFLDFDRIDGLVLLSPLEPAIGNIRARTAKRVRMRFYHGERAVEGETAFLGVREVCPGCREMMWRFPENVSLSKVRRTPRVDLVNKSFIAMLFSDWMKRPQGARVCDISSEGISLAIFPNSEELPEGQKVTVNFAFINGEELRVVGVVRRSQLMRDPDDDSVTLRRYGLRFDVTRMEQTTYRKLVRFIQTFNS